MYIEYHQISAKLWRWTDSVLGWVKVKFPPMKMLRPGERKQYFGIQSTHSIIPVWGTCCWKIAHEQTTLPTFANKPENLKQKHGWMGPNE